VQVIFIHFTGFLRKKERKKEKKESMCNRDLGWVQLGCW
jgi:hypothetical protein